MPRYGWDYARREPRGRPTVGGMGEWRDGGWMWYGDRSDPRNRLGYGADYRPWTRASRADSGSRYDQGYGGVAYRQGAGGFYGGPGYASTGYERGYWGRPSGRPGEAYDLGWRGPGRRGSVRSAYDRGYAARFRRPPEGAELKEFRAEEMGPLWDR